MKMNEICIKMIKILNKIWMNMKKICIKFVMNKICSKMNKI